MQLSLKPELPIVLKQHSEDAVEVVHLFDCQHRKRVQQLQNKISVLKERCEKAKKKRDQTMCELKIARAQHQEALSTLSAQVTARIKHELLHLGDQQEPSQLAKADLMHSQTFRSSMDKINKCRTLPMSNKSSKSPSKRK